jgi:hypothetical protein
MSHIPESVNELSPCNEKLCTTKSWDTKIQSYYHTGTIRSHLVEKPQSKTALWAGQVAQVLGTPAQQV